MPMKDMPASAVISEIDNGIEKKKKKKYTLTKRSGTRLCGAAVVLKNFSDARRLQTQVLFADPENRFSSRKGGVGKRSIRALIFDVHAFCYHFDTMLSLPVSLDYFLDVLSFPSHRGTRSPPPVVLPVLLPPSSSRCSIPSSWARYHVFLSNGGEEENLRMWRPKKKQLEHHFPNACKNRGMNR